MILRNAQVGTVEGLITAATVWLSAALGVACGLRAWRTIADAIPLSLLMLLRSVGWRDLGNARVGMMMEAANFS